MESKGSFCPKCQDTPVIKLTKQGIKIKCECGYDGTVPVDDYLQSIKVLMKKAKKGFHSSVPQLKQLLKFHYDKCVNECKDSDALKEAYETCLRINTSLATISDIMNISESNNQKMKNNNMRNSHDYSNKPITPDNVIEFFKNYSVILPCESSIAKFTKEKDINFSKSEECLYSQTLLQNGTILATTEEGTAYISDPLNNYQSDKQLKAKIEEGTKVLELENNKFLFKEEEGPYKIWSIDNDESVFSFKEDIDKYEALPNERVAVYASSNNALLIYSTSAPYSETPIKEIKVNIEECIDVKYVNKMILLFTKKGNNAAIFVYNSDTYEQIKTIEVQNVNGEANCVIMNDKKVLLVNFQRHLAVVNIEKGETECEYELLMSVNLNIEKLTDKYLIMTEGYKQWLFDIDSNFYEVYDSFAPHDFLLGVTKDKKILSMDYNCERVTVWNYSL